MFFKSENKRKLRILERWSWLLMLYM